MCRANECSAQKVKWELDEFGIGVNGHGIGEHDTVIVGCCVTQGGVNRDRISGHDFNKTDCFVTGDREDEIDECGGLGRPGTREYDVSGVDGRFTRVGIDGDNGCEADRRIARGRF